MVYTIKDHRFYTFYKFCDRWNYNVIMGLKIEKIIWHIIIRYFFKVHKYISMMRNEIID